MNQYSGRLMPAPQETISTSRDLDNFFNKMSVLQYSRESNNLPVPQYEAATVDISLIYCYVSLEFVQQYYTKHLFDSHCSWVYTFSPVIHIPGVYKVTAKYQVELC